MDKLTNQLMGIKYRKPERYKFSACLKMKIAIKSNSISQGYYPLIVFLFFLMFCLINL